MLVYNLKCFEVRPLQKGIIHKSTRYSFTLGRWLQSCACRVVSVCVCQHRVLLLLLLLLLHVRCCCAEVHINIYIGFRKQLLLRKNLFLLTQIQNKETLLRLPVIDMWACFWSHWLEEVSVWDLFLTGLKLLVVWHIFEQLLDAGVFKVMGAVYLRNGEV